MQSLQRVKGYVCSKCHQIFASVGQNEARANWGPYKRAKAHVSLSRICKGAEVYEMEIPFRETDAVVGGSGSAWRQRDVQGKIYVYICPPRFVDFMWTLVMNPFVV